MFIVVDSYGHNNNGVTVNHGVTHKVYINRDMIQYINDKHKSVVTGFPSQEIYLTDDSYDKIIKIYE